MSNLLNLTKLSPEQNIEEINLNVLETNIPTDSVDRTPAPVRPALLDLLVRNKKLSHLIARSWLPGAEGEKIKAIFLGEQDKLREMLVKEGVVTVEESQLSLFEVDPNPQPNEYPLGAFAGSIVENPDPSTPYVLIFKIPYPQNVEHDKVTEDQLRSWLASPPDSAPWRPFEFSRWIPYTC